MTPETDSHIPPFEEVKELLKFLPELYPGAEEWLKNRHEDIKSGKATCATVYVDEQLVGISIGMIKNDGRFKICTIYVESDYRGLGFSSVLMDEMIRSAGGRTAYVTGARSLRDSLLPFFSKHGFVLIATVSSLYGENRDEDVYERDITSQSG